jgi:hypothetical protein
MRLARILDDGQAVIFGEADDWLHIARLAIEVHGQDGFCARVDRPLQMGRIQVVEIRVDINENWFRSDGTDRQSRGDKRVGGDNHFVPSLDSERSET